MSQNIDMRPISASDLAAVQKNYTVDLKYGLVGWLTFKDREVKIVWYGIEPKKVGGKYGNLFNLLAAGGVLFCDGDCGSGGQWAYGPEWAGTPSSDADARPTLTLNEEGYIKWTFPKQGGGEVVVGEGLGVQCELNYHNEYCKKSFAKSGGKGGQSSGSSWGTYAAVALVVIASLGYAYREQVTTFVGQYR